MKNISSNCEIISKYFRVQNGNQIDIHIRVVDETGRSRELTAYGKIDEGRVEHLLNILNHASTRNERKSNR